MTLQMFGPVIQQLHSQSNSSQLRWLCVAPPCALSSCLQRWAWPGLRTSRKGWEGHTCTCGCPEVESRIQFQAERRWFTPSFPVSFNLSSMSLPFSCALYLTIRTTTKPQHFIYFWLCGECVNFPLYQQHDFTHPRVDVGEDSRLQDGDEGREEQNIPVRQSFLTVSYT